MATAPHRPADITQIQQSALLDVTLTRILRYAAQMQADLRAGQLNVEHADQLGRSVLTVVREAAAITARAEMAARSAPAEAVRESAAVPLRFVAG